MTEAERLETSRALYMRHCELCEKIKKLESGGKFLFGNATIQALKVKRGIVEDLMIRLDHE